MVSAKPLSPPSTGYDEDFSLWLAEQAGLLRQRRFSEIDLPNLIEEVESLGKSEKRALRSAIRLCLMHLLKWKYQTDRQSRSWLSSIRNARADIDDLIGDNPSFAALLPQALPAEYATAMRAAADETGLPLAAFPADCPFTVDQLRDPDFLPA